MRNELQNRLVSILKRKQKTEAELETKKRKIEDLRGHLQNLLKVLPIHWETYFLYNFRTRNRLLKFVVTIWKPFIKRKWQSMM